MFNITFSIILEILVVLKTSEFCFKLTFKGPLNANLTHLSYIFEGQLNANLTHLLYVCHVENLSR